MKPPRSKYTKRSTTYQERWSRRNVQFHLVAWDDARSEIGIHINEDAPSYYDALKQAERDGFKRVFIHRFPENVISIFRKQA